MIASKRICVLHYSVVYFFWLWSFSHSKNCTKLTGFIETPSQLNVPSDLCFNQWFSSALVFSVRLCQDETEGTFTYVADQISVLNRNKNKSSFLFRFNTLIWSRSFWHLRPFRTQISLRIPAVWSVFVVRIKTFYILYHSICVKWRFWSVCA